MDMRLQHGFSLVEVLVTLLVLKVGLLGILAAQTVALRQVQDATQRTQAVALSYGLLNELRANQSLSTTVGQRVTRYTELPVIPVCTPPTPCSAEQLADAQLHHLFSQLQPQHGAGLYEAEFCLQSQGAAVRLDVSWQQRAYSAEPTGQSCAAGAGRSGFTVQSRWR
ncbi:hypothetical protein AR688_13875 [Rheinheimera sp. EpRS3]|nr:hypothetical protein AR688_13875 [Rheinheimera sp. EpRS3]